MWWEHEQLTALPDQLNGAVEVIYDSKLRSLEVRNGQRSTPAGTCMTICSQLPLREYMESA